MEKNNDNQLNLKIENLNINGEGVSFCEDKKISVKYVLPNEEVLCESVFNKKNYIKAKLNKIIKPSKLRKNAPCPYYEKCGGCDFQHLSYEDSVLVKKEIIKNYFSDIFNKELSFISSDKYFDYRNKASFLVKGNKIGFQQEGSNNLVEINKCLISNDKINLVLKITKEWLTNYKNPLVNHLVVRVLNENIIVTLVVSGMPNNIEAFKVLLSNNLHSTYGLYLNFNKSKDKILSENWKHVCGLKELNDSFNNIKYSVHPYSFMQVNNCVRNKLYNKVLEYIKDEIVIEGYSGVGLLTAILSTKAKKVIGIEINKKATENANRIKKENNILNIENINGDCKNELPKLIEKYKTATFVIDPPRSGCDIKTLQSLKESGIQNIIYISCNPYTLKQNLKFLNDKYKIDELSIYDMFPQTLSCELLAKLSIKR